MIKRYALYNGMMHDESGQDYWTSEGNRYAFVLYTDHIAEVCKYRDKILEVCAECSSCGGTGLITISVDDRDVVHEMDKPIVKTEPCEDCADLREVLGQ